jgi:hypothetical protein
MSSIFQYASRPQEPAPTEAAMPVQQAPQVAPPQASAEAPNDNASIFQASQKLPEPPKEESFGHKVVRHTARTAARAGEAIVGLPGDIASGALRAGNWLAEKLNMNPMDAEEMSKFSTSFLPVKTSAACMKESQAIISSLKAKPKRFPMSLFKISRLF